MSTQNNILLSLSPFFPEKNGSTLAQQVFEVIQQHIVTGELRPNQRLLDSGIAKELGISRTPVREALKCLEVVGYVRALSNGGVIVIEHSTEQILYLYEIREALETMAVKLACDRATEEQLNKLEEFYNRGVEGVRNGDISRDIELHRGCEVEFYATCGNEGLLSLIQTFRNQYYNQRIHRVLTSEDWRTQLKHHGRILKALRKRSADRAAKALERHLRTSLKVALQRL